jgi:hypothetical protein
MTSDRPTADIIVVFQEPRHERFPGLHAAVAVERHVDDVAADLVGLVPGPVARNEMPPRYFAGNIVPV